MKIQVDNLTVSYEKNKILNKVSFKLSKGEHISILGRNGSGKSTFLKSIVNLIEKESGTIKINDKDINDDNSFLKSVGFLFQNPNDNFVTSDVKDELIFRMENVSISSELMNDRIDSIATQLNIEHLLERKISTLSEGEKQRVALASILIADKDILLLDEPTSMLDSYNSKVFNSLINELKDVSIILITHKKSEIKKTDKVYELKNGSLKEVKK
jgi:energy-coupling factor transport system ATP-binding protein